jgi:LAO/AO transport system kinase
MSVVAGGGRGAAEQPEALAREILERRSAAVARGITWCETGGEHADRLLGLLPPLTVPVLGLTGPPGAGKSTLVSALVRQLRSSGRSVGVLAVDPTSPVSGGALLGDRVRLEGVSGDPGVFFRSLASRGAQGGLSDATRRAARVLGAASFDEVIVETVGAGQSQVDIMRVADTVAVVLIPGAGDEIQALKAGMMEIADVFCCNKADQPGLGELRSHLSALLRLLAHADWRPPVVETVATMGQGIPELLEALAAHRSYLAGGTGSRRASVAAASEVERLAHAAFDRAIVAERDALLAELAAGHLSEQEAAAELALRCAARLVSP